MAEQQTRHRFAVALNIRGANQIRARALSDRPKQSGTDQLNAQGHWSGKIRSVDAIVSADTNQLEIPQLRRPAQCDPPSDNSSIVHSPSICAAPLVSNEALSAYGVETSWRLRFCRARPRRSSAAERSAGLVSVRGWRVTIS